MEKPDVAAADAIKIRAAWNAVQHSVRNLGRQGICAMAMSAVETALSDLKATLLELALVSLFGQVHDATPISGIGGLTSYDIDKLQEFKKFEAEQYKL